MPHNLSSAHTPFDALSPASSLTLPDAASPAISLALPDAASPARSRTLVDALSPASSLTPRDAMSPATSLTRPDVVLPAGVGPSPAAPPARRIAIPAARPALRRHFSEGARRLPAASRTPRAAAADVSGRGASVAASPAQRDLLRSLGELRADEHAHAAGATAAAPPPAASGLAVLADGAAHVALVRHLAPELMDGEAPIAAGAAVVGPDGSIFDGARAGNAGLAARLDGAPLIPCLAADALLEWLADAADPTPEAFAAAAARILRCPITLEVPAVPVTARDGVTYGRGALSLHVATQRSLGASPRLPVSRDPYMGPQPPINCSLRALATRLGLVSDTAACDDAEAQAAAAVKEREGPIAAATDELADFLDVYAQPVALHSVLSLSEPPTAFAACACRCAFGDALGDLTLMLDDSPDACRSWPAHRAAVNGRGGVAQVALSETSIASLGGFAPAPGVRASVPKIWSLGGELLRRVEPALPATITSLHFAHDNLLVAATAGGDVATWRIAAGLARTPRSDRHLGPDARIGLGADHELTAVALGSRLELATPRFVAAGPLRLPAADVRTLVPCLNAVAWLDARQRPHLYAPCTTPSPGQPAGALVAVPLPPPRGGRPIRLLAAHGSFWAAAADDGGLAVYREDGALFGEAEAPGPVAFMAMQPNTLNVVTVDQRFCTFILQEV